MKITIELPKHLTPDYVMAHAHAGYWYRLGEGYIEGRTKMGKWPKLTAARLAAGCRALVSERVGLHDSNVVGRVLTGRADGADLDVLLQLSLFGKVIYG